MPALLALVLVTAVWGVTFVQIKDALELLEREEHRPLEELVAAAVDLLRHAVHAAEVAAVGDRDAQVAQRPTEAIHDRSVAGAFPTAAGGNARGMSDPHANEPNETQQRIDEDDEGNELPADVPWGETQDQPHEGEEGQDIV